MIDTDRLLAEAEKLRDLPGIHFVDSPFGERVARVLGTGLEVFEIIQCYVAAEGDLERLMRAFHWLKAEQILAAIDYYRAYPDEIDAILDEAEALVPEELRDGYRTDRSRLR
jgi:uncharacterized protein (DUF433 family)